MTTSIRPIVPARPRVSNATFLAQANAMKKITDLVQAECKMLWDAMKAAEHEQERLWQEYEDCSIGDLELGGADSATRHMMFEKWEKAYIQAGKAYAAYRAVDDFSRTLLTKLWQ
jgi:hypothetical protein